MPSPTTPILDDFSGAAAGTDLSLYDGNWSFDAILGVLEFQTILGALADPGPYPASNLRNDISAADAEAYHDFSTAVQSGVWYLYARRNPASGDGYYLGLDNGGFWQVLVSLGGGSTVLASGLKSAITALWLKVDGTTISAYYQSGGAWTLLTSVTDASISAAGTIGIYTNDPAGAAISYFGGGSTAPPPPVVPRVQVMQPVSVSPQLRGG